MRLYLQYIVLVMVIMTFLLVGLYACDDNTDPNSNATVETLTREEIADEETSDSNNNSTDEVTQAEDIEDLFNKVKNNSPTSERIQALRDIAMHYYWYGGDLKVAEEEIFKGITLHGDYDVVEQAFGLASEIDPYDSDLKYSLASTQILQKKIPEALQTYEEILKFDDKHFNAQLMHAIYSKVEDNEEDYQAGFDRLKELDEQKAAAYEEKIELVETITKEELVTEIPTDLPETDHAFVVLGYALSEDGEMEETLLERLKVAKEAAETYPDSKIIVTGGVPKKGITEADVMFDWLTENGIEEERIFKEDRATDTVENALFSMEIIDEEDIQDITIISSATHMRRALTIFNEVNQMMEKKGDEQTDRDISNIVYMDFESNEEAGNVSKDEELVIYRDLIRATGIWQFPGAQR